MDPIPKLDDFTVKLRKLRAVAKKFAESYEDLKEKNNGEGLDQVTLDLNCLLMINSLFWLLLVCNGVDVKDHDIRIELNRIKSAMSRAKEIKEKPNAPKLVKKVAESFVRNALFDGKRRDDRRNDDRANKRFRRR